MRINRVLFWLILPILCGSCNNSEQPVKVQVPRSGIFFDFRVEGDEDGGEATCLLQFKRGNSLGNSEVIPGAGWVEIDGHRLEADSTKFGGAYYEWVEEASLFQGHHTIQFHGNEQAQFEESFDYNIFSLTREIPEVVPRTPLHIYLSGFEEEDGKLRVVMTDTAFGTNDVQQVLPVNRGVLTIPALLWRRLSAGPIALELYREEKKIFSNALGRGWISASYSLSREFELKR
jgi:hypothetical protein